MDRKSIKQLSERAGSVRLDQTNKPGAVPSAVKKTGKLPTTKSSSVKAPSLDKKSTKLPDMAMSMPQMKGPRVKTLDDKPMKEVSRTGATARVPKGGVPDIKSGVKSKMELRKPALSTGTAGSSSIKKKPPNKSLDNTEDILKLLKSKPRKNSSDETTSSSESSDGSDDISSYIKQAGANRPKKSKANSKKTSESSEDSEIEAARELKRILNDDEYDGLDLDEILKESTKVKMEKKEGKPGFYTKKSQEGGRRPVNLKSSKGLRGNVFSDDEEDGSDYDENGMIKSLVIPPEVHMKYQNMMKKKVAAVGRTASPLHDSDLEKYGENPKPVNRLLKDLDKGDEKDEVVSKLMKEMEMTDSDDDLLGMLEDVTSPSHKSVKGDAQKSFRTLRERLYDRKSLLEKTDSAISTMSQKLNKDRKPDLYSKKHQDILSDLTPENWSSKMNSLTKDILKTKARLTSGGGDDKDPFMSGSMKKFYDTVDESLKTVNALDTSRKGTLKSKEFKDMLKHLKDDEIPTKTASKIAPKAKTGKVAEGPLASGDRASVRRSTVNKMKI